MKNPATIVPDAMQALMALGKTVGKVCRNERSISSTCGPAEIAGDPAEARFRLS